MTIFFNSVSYRFRKPPRIRLGAHRFNPPVQVKIKERSLQKLETIRSRFQKPDRSTRRSFLLINQNWLAIRMTMASMGFSHSFHFRDLHGSNIWFRIGKSRWRIHTPNDDVIEWLDESIGPSNWSFRKDCFSLFFRNEVDALRFKMFWL
jgi:hypothetical protein